MCKVADIIVVDKYIGDDGVEVGRHSFVVLSADKGCIEGLDYDLVTNALSSFKSPEQKEKVLKYKSNLEVKAADKTYVTGHNNEDGFIKAGCFVYFNKKHINFYTLGALSVEMWEKLEELLEILNEKDKITKNVNNLEKETVKQ